MNRSKVFILAMLAATHVRADPSAGVAPDDAQVARLLALGGDGFRIHRTDHFLVASDSDDPSAQALASRLESTYRAVKRFCEVAKLRIHPSPERLPVVYFNRWSDFERYARTIGFEDASVPGFYHLQSNTVAFCNLLDLPPLREISLRVEQAEARRDPSVAPERLKEWRSQRDALVETFNRLVIQHEAAHQILFNIGVLSRDADNPDWLVEGLACQFEVSTPETENPMRLADFREALGAAPSAAEIDDRSIQASLEKGRLLSLADLLAEAEFGVKDESTRRFRYAQAWGLVKYLHHTHSPAFAAYLRRRSIVGVEAQQPRKLSGVADFEAAFGPLAPLEKALWVYIIKLPFDPPG